MKFSKALKILLLSLILLSTTVEFIHLTKAETWQKISLPYEITSPGNYQIEGSYSGQGSLVGGVYCALAIVDCNNVVVDGQNCAVTLTGADSYGVYLGTSDYRVTNLDLENLAVTGGAYCIFSANSTDVTLQNDVATGTLFLGDTSSDSTATTTLLNCTINKTSPTTGGSISASGNLNIQSSTVNSAKYAGIQLESPSNNLTINECTLNGGIVTSENAYDTTISNSALNNVQLTVDSANQATVSLNTATDCSLTIQNAANSQVNGNIFTGDNSDNALTLTDTDASVYSNTFSNNNDAVTWYAYDETANCNLYVYSNAFQNDQYTLSLGYGLTDGSNNQKLIFYNNLVNDASYSDPSAYSLWQVPSIPPTALALNTTVGNYWDNPGGTGYSQTAVNLGKGFAAPYDFFGNKTIYDYLPYATSAAPSPSPTPSASPKANSTPTPTIGSSPTPATATTSPSTSAESSATPSSTTTPSPTFPPSIQPPFPVPSIGSPLTQAAKVAPSEKPKPTTSATTQTNSNPFPAALSPTSPSFILIIVFTVLVIAYVARVSTRNKERNKPAPKHFPSNGSKTPSQMR